MKVTWRAYKDLDECAIFSWGNPSHCACAKRYLLRFLQDWLQKNVLQLWKDWENNNNFSDQENIRLLEDVWGNYGLLTQSLKTGSVVLKKKEAWMRIAESVNAVGGQGRAVSAIQKRWKGMRLSQRQPGGLPEKLVPYEDFILTILGENSNHINGIEQREYRFDLLNQFLSSPTSLSHHLVTLTITIIRNVQILVPCALCGDRIVRWLCSLLCQVVCVFTCI